MNLHHILNIRDFGGSCEILECCAESRPAGGDGLAGVEFGIVEEAESRVEGDECFGVGAETFSGFGKVERGIGTFDCGGVGLDICEVGLELEVGEGAEERGADDVCFEGAVSADEIFVEPGMKCQLNVLVG